MKIFNFLKNFTFSDVSRGIEPVEKCSDQPTDDVFGSFGDGFGQSHQEPNAVSTEQTTLLQRNAVNCVQIAAQPKAGPCQTITRFTAPLESVRLRFLQQTVNKTGCCFPAKFFSKITKFGSPDDGFNDVALHIQRHVPAGSEIAVEDVVPASPVVVPDGVTLLTVADRLLVVVTGAARRETRHTGRLLRRSTTL